jgi:hypothetical protein
MKTPIKAIISIVGLAATISMGSVAHAKEFSILIYESSAELAKRTSATQATDYWGSYNQFAGELVKAGVLRGGTALSESESAVTKGKGSAKGGIKLGGYFVIDVEDLDAAKKWASKVPTAAASVEVIAHRPNPTMANPPAMK